ncbi:MAG: transposase [Myxococcales bacterium]|nr:transposase [Myxococcales bacterium]
MFFGKRRQTVKILTWDGTGAVLWYKRLDRGVFEIPRPEREGETSVIVSEVAFEALFAASLQALIASLQGTIAALESALTNHASENELLKRRLYGTKSERSGTSELQLTLGNLLADQAKLQAELDALTKQPTGTTGENGAPEPAPEPASPPPPPEEAESEKPRPKGRRDLSASKLPRVVVEIRDGGAEASGGRLIDWETSYQLMFQRACFKVLVKKVAKYEVSVHGAARVMVAPSPKPLFPRAMLHTSVLAWLAVQKFALGVPNYRLERHVSAMGESSIARPCAATSRALAARSARPSCTPCCATPSRRARSSRPTPRAPPSSRAPATGPKRACKKGHFFTIVADRDHVLFSYVERHTQDAVASLFKGFRGYLQSDASSVYDILDRGHGGADPPVLLVGCWAHTRRYFFEAAICKYPIGVAGLTRIRAIYVADNALAHMPPIDRTRERLTRVLPLVDEFFAWVRTTARATLGRTLATKALGYAENQEQELRRVFLDGRLPLDNTRSERALRTIVVGRKNWLFYGSDLHAHAAAALFQPRSLLPTPRPRSADLPRGGAQTPRDLAEGPVPRARPEELGGHPRAPRPGRARGPPRRRHRPAAARPHPGVIGGRPPLPLRDQLAASPPACRLALPSGSRSSDAARAMCTGYKTSRRASARLHSLTRR